MAEDHLSLLLHIPHASHRSWTMHHPGWFRETDVHAMTVHGDDKLASSRGVGEPEYGVARATCRALALQAAATQKEQRPATAQFEASHQS